MSRICGELPPLIQSASVELAEALAAPAPSRGEVASAAAAPMHHEDIKAAIRKRGVSPASVAAHLGVSDQMVSSVIRGVSKSRRIATAIADVTGLSLDVLWPGRYSAAESRDRLAELLGSKRRVGSTKAAKEAA